MRWNSFFRVTTEIEMLVFQQYAEAASDVCALEFAQMVSFQPHRTEILNEDE